MKALILKDKMQFVYGDVPKHVPAKNEVLIRIKAVSVCGSDIAGSDGSTGRRRPPIVMGHEASGIIEETGSKATRFAKGDRVTFDSTIYCGTCRFCRSGRVNLCDNRRVLGVSCQEYRQHGAFCQYIALPEHIVYKLPDNVTISITCGRGAAKALDAAGAQSTFCQAVQCLQKGGIFVTLANLENAFPLNISKVVTQELTVKGSCAFSGEFPQVLELISSGAIRVDYAISHLVPLSQGGDFIRNIYKEKPDDFFKCILLPPEPQK